MKECKGNLSKCGKDGVKTRGADTNHTVEHNFRALQSHKSSQRAFPLMKLSQQYSENTQVARMPLLIVCALCVVLLKFWIASIRFQPQQMPAPLWDGSGPR